MRIAPAIVLSPATDRVGISSPESLSLGAGSGASSHRVPRCYRSAGSGDRRPSGDLAEKVARWRQRFFAPGVAGLQKDAPRPGRTPTISARLRDGS